MGISPPVPIPIPLSTAPGSSPQESGGRLINAYAEPLGASAGVKQAWRRSPGLSLFSVSSQPGYRGGILANNLIYAAIGPQVVSVNEAGTQSVIGALAGTDPVIFAHNNKVPIADIVAVDSDGAFLVIDARSVQPDITFPDQAISGGNSTTSTDTPTSNTAQNAFDGDTTTEWLSSQEGAATDVLSTPAQAISGGDLSGATPASAAFAGVGSFWDSAQVGAAVLGTAYLGQNFGAENPRDITSIQYFQTTAKAVTSALVQYSDNLTTWVTAATVSIATNALTVATFTSVGAHQAWRLIANSAATTGASWELSQVEFLGAGVSGVAYIGQDFGVGNPQNIVAMSVFQANATIGNITSAIVQHSDDLVTWTAVATFALNSPGAAQVLTWASVGAHRGWRLLANADPGQNVRWGVFELTMSLAAVTQAPTVEAYPGGILPVVNSVCFQDGFFFFTTGNRQVFASALNDIPINALTFVTLESRPSQNAVRCVAYKGLLFAFTDSSCEIWQDTAQPFPGFPYSRLVVLDRGLLASSALAGDTENFGNLLWVADDFGVYRLSGLFQPEKVSSPDIDRLIQAQALVDPTQLFAGCYVSGGRSMWTISSPNWTWEFNINANVWNERSSFYSGILSRWRAIGGLKAFGNWIVGDDQTGNLGFIDSTNFTEFGAPQLFRVETGPVENFPNRIRVGRTDIDLVSGTGQSAGATSNATDPVIMIFWSDDDGVHWVGPVTRAIGEQAAASNRIWATSLGRTGSQGRRWRYDVSDPVYVGLLGATMNANPRAM
jgi:hypothetical protein